MSETNDNLREGFLQTDLEWVERNDPLYIDPVTETFNRQAYEVFIPRLLEEARKNKTPLTISVLDLDGFKKYNDVNGHDAGDQLLKKIGESWEKLIRKTDYLLRYGGDEWVMAFRNTTKKQFEENILPKVRQIVEENGLGISIGTSQLKNDDDPRTLFIRADAEMYKDKNSRK